MALRVTQGMMQAQLLRNLSKNTERMTYTQNQLATGRKINKPSDDPVGITYALRYRSDLSINEQYQRNIDAANSSVSHLDTVLGQLGDVIQRAKELTVQGVNGTNPQTALDAIASELDQLYEQTVTVGNDQVNGKYTFNGQMTDKKPYDLNNAKDQKADVGDIVYRMAAGITIPVNQNGNDVFGYPVGDAKDTGDNLFDVLKGLSTAFKSGGAGATALMDKLDSRYNKILNIRSEVGAKTNRIEMLGSRLSDLEVNLTSLDSKVEDADMSETITQLKTDENVYQASLSTGAKVIQPSLIDYLR